MFEISYNFPSCSKSIRIFQKDRVIISLFSCKVYDQVDVKRCNKCHNFGHWAKECDHEAACSICSDAHESKSCPHFNDKEFHDHKCINCKRHGMVPINHKADSSTCPIYMKELARCKAILQSGLN